MSADQVFSISSSVAVLGWLVLAAGAAFRRESLLKLAGLGWPLALSALYALLIMSFFALAPGGFDSLAHVQALFSYHWAAVAGWVHYLAFDLFVGGWISSEVLRLGLPRLALVMILPLTFVFGPIGLLAFFVLKISLHKRVSFA